MKSISLSEDGLKAALQVIVFVKMTNDGKDSEGHYTNLRFFEKQNNIWMLTNWHNEMTDKNNRFKNALGRFSQSGRQ